MKLSRLYSNKPSIFEPIDFLPGLNVILAEIRLEENRKKDTHNLGKSTLGRLIDFCFLSNKDNKLFLFKHLELFKEFTFYLEIERPDGTYVTVRRSVSEATKISFKVHRERSQDFGGLPPSGWNHLDVPLTRARQILDGLLDWRALKPWSYRKELGYLLRSQDDYRDVFHLGKFAGKHSQWKPFLAHVIGFDSDILNSYYEKEEELSEKREKQESLKGELGGSVEDSSKIDGILLLKQREAERKQRLLDSFDFGPQDKERTKELVEDIDRKIAQLNKERYSLNRNNKKILYSLQEDEIVFDPEEAERIFREAGVYFSGQIKKDFVQLIQFNRAITEERRRYLKEERAYIEKRLRDVDSELSALGKKRAEALSFLSETDVFNKYKKLSDELVTIKADIASLERQREFVNRLRKLGAEIRALEDERIRLQQRIEKDVYEKNSDKSSVFSSIRLHFSEIVEDVIDRKAVLSVFQNQKGYLEFSAEILDESGNTTSADWGHSYRKLLCIAFDMAVLRAHLGEKFPRFVYHDGVFESLDDRKKWNLLSVLRRYADVGIQSIITVIDSDLPAQSDEDEPIFEDSEVVLRLHDEGESGRLFKMKGW